MDFETCPRPDVLSAFVNGELAEDTAQTVAKHAEGCALCEQKIDRIIQQGDSVIQHLRQPAAVHTVDGGQTVDRLMANAAQLVAPRTKHAPDFSSNVAMKSPSGAVSFNVFMEALKASGLIDKDEIYQAMLSIKTRDTQEFALELVNQNKLTLYQAGLLARGKSKGLVLGNYEVLEKVGQGGMGLVFKARHRRMGRIVALKILPSAAMKSPNATKRFYREVQTAAKMHHENVVVAHDADEVEGVHFLAMEFVDGKDLSRIVKKQGPLPVQQAVNYVVQAARGLAYAHENGIVHRDIKPQNLLLDSQGMVKVLDLGLARLDQEFDSDLDESGEPNEDVSLTKTGTVMGTVDYMAPEQAANSKTSDARSDIYSLGCTLHFLLTRKTVFGGSSVMEKLVAHREHEIPSLRKVRRDVPHQVEKVFQRMVAKHPDNRYQSMTDLLAELEPIATGKSPPVVPPPVVSDSSDSLPDLADLEAEMQQSFASPLSTPSYPPPVSMQETLTPSQTTPGIFFPETPLNSTPSNSGSFQSPGFAQPARPHKPPRDYLAVVIASVVTGVILLLVSIVIYGAITDAGRADLFENDGPGRALIVIPEDKFYEDEFQCVRDALIKENIQYEIATPTGRKAKSKHGKEPDVTANRKLTSVNAANYDAIIFTGGAQLTPFKDKSNVKFMDELVRDCDKNNKPVFAIREGQYLLRDVPSSYSTLKKRTDGYAIADEIKKLRAKR